ncbi:hypothetical protein [Anaerosphaera multitolerans]|uniref:Uncharacterized protein n=1 Tax=Anaerosphaera multitolerans TaxID=2487351 RepID=A0A437S6I5_9FIRM|nr:hypothetical protein [Anaerosphaera multitolerans]RVU54619.1 hypothetical protein EF514_06765 [Anaerosphaera multitolerans]
MKKIINLKNLSRLLYGSGIIIATVTLYKIIKVKMILPPGVCPVDNQRNTIFLSIGLLISSFIIDLFLERKNK